MKPVGTGDLTSERLKESKYNLFVWLSPVNYHRPSLHLFRFNGKKRFDQTYARRVTKNVRKNLKMII